MATLTGDAGNNTLTGTTGDDSLSGLVGNDSLDGSDGNDTLDGGPGSDTAVGGLGDDLYFVDSTLDTAIEGPGDGTDTIKASSGSYTLPANVENLVYIGSGNFTETGNALANLLIGGPGNDSFNGSDGNDTLIDGGGGNDTLSSGFGDDLIQITGGSDSVPGSTGTDTLVVDYSASNRNETLSSFVVSSGSGTISDGSLSPLWKVVFSGIEKFDVTTGSGNDALSFTASHGGMTLSGGSGDDTLVTDGDTFPANLGDSLDGGIGNDYVSSGLGDDTIVGGSGADTIDDGRGNDWIDAGDGNDSLSMATDNGPGSSDNDTVLAGPGNDTIDSFYGDDSIDGGDGDDQFLDVSYNDTNIGGSETFSGGSGQDLYVLHFRNSAGPTHPAVITDFATGPGGDAIDLGDLQQYMVGYSSGNPFSNAYFQLLLSGADTLLQFDRDSTGLTYGWQTILTLKNTDAAAFTQENFASPFNVDPYAPLPPVGPGETLVGTTGNDAFSGSNGDDIISGGAGNDTLAGLQGNDSLDGGAGNDSLTDDKGGDDTIIAGAGADTINDGYGANILDGGDGDDLFVNVGTSYKNADPFYGPPPGSDTITGGPGSDLFAISFSTPTDQFADVITDFQAGAGGDVLDVLSTVGQLIGFPQNADPFSGGFFRLLQAGADTYFQIDVDGPASSYTWTTAIVLRNTVASSLTADNFASPFNYPPSGAGGIIVAGDSGDNSISGTAGADTLSGNAGNDTLLGNAGNDVLSGGDGNDSIDDGAGNDSVDGGDGNDVLTSYRGNDTLLGGAGDDQFTIKPDIFGAASQRSIDGGAGTDTLTVNFDLGPLIPARDAHISNGTISAQGGNSTYTGIETFDIRTFYVGADYINISTASTPSKIATLSGNDTIVSGSGDDTIDSGAGADIVTGGLGHDWFREDFSYVNAPPIGPDTITDFQPGEDGDVLDMSNYFFWDAFNNGLSNPFAKGLLRLFQSGPDTLLQVNDQPVDTPDWKTAVILRNTDAAAFTRENFSYPFNPHGPEGILTTGDGGANTLAGTLDNDTLDGGAGNDSISADAGDDSVLGGAGNDLIKGDQGNDSLFGGDGNDTLYGYYDDFALNDPDADFLSGGDGNDSLSGDDKTDTLFGDGGNDTIYAGRGDDSVDGGDGDDFISGDATFAGSNDTLFGGNGADTLRGDWGADSIDGGAGNDLFLQVSSSTLPSGPETIAGGSGSDRYDLAAGFTNADVVLDFQTGPAGDVINLASLLGAFSGYVADANPFGTGHLRLSQTGSDTVLQADTDGPGNAASFQTILVLKNTIASSFSTANFAAPYAYDPWLGAGNDTIAGDKNANAIQGYGGDDSLFGDAGNDTLNGGVGNDTVDGGDGTDTAEYGGTRDDYIFTLNGPVLSIVDTRSGSNDGSDLVSNVEFFQFAPGTIFSLAQLVTPSVDVHLHDDFNADGMSDILWRDTDSGAVAVWEMNGASRQSGVVVPGAEAVPQNWHIAGTGDFNADGMSDILWRDMDSGAVAIWEMNGASRQNGVVVPGAEAVPQNWHIASTGDFNADGMCDILWRDTDSGAVGIWEMNGTSLQNGVVVPGAEAVPQNWQIAGTGDFNADGESDILWRDMDSGAVAIWEMNGTSRQNGVVIPGAAAVPQNWHIAGTGDFNADGKSDILWRDTDSGAVLIWEMNGTSRPYGAVVPGAEAIPQNWVIAGTGDFNGDGKSDILWRTTDSGAVGIWEMNGTSLQNGVVVPGAEAVPQNWHIFDFI